MTIDGHFDILGKVGIDNGDRVPELGKRSGGGCTTRPAPTINASNTDMLIVKIEFRSGFWYSQYVLIKCPVHELELKIIHYIAVIFDPLELRKFVRPFFAFASQ